MPDIDVDFGPEGRGEVIEYVRRKYGNENVVQIVTFGTMAARAVIRDVGRSLDYPYAFCDMVSKMIPKDLGITINKALDMNPDLKKLYNQDDKAKRLIDMSRKLEGLSRNVSMHAAGVVISDRNVDSYVPLSRAGDGTITTQYIMTTLEELGLLKMDFLGLRNLTVIKDASRMIKKKDENFSIDNIPYDDKSVYEYISTGKTEGIFQLESAGMKNFMKELKPESLEDLTAGISLYRPGPMDFIPKYIEGKNNKSSITYECPQLEHILAPTYGCIVYQEQVMQIVRDLAGYSYGRSDLVRRAMSKKKQSVMEKERQNFVYGNESEGVKGCVANGIDEAIANHIYDEMIDFAKYAFNKSHAAAYAVVSYQTAYLKRYYPVEFMAALMTSVLDNTTKVSEYIMACRQMGINILPPDINNGEGDFSASGSDIRYGMSAIKGLGRPVIAAIIKERTENGPYTSIKDLAQRLSGKEINKRSVESLIKAGALDGLKGNRNQKLLVYSTVIESVGNEKKKSITGQMSLFDFVDESQAQSFEVSYPDVDELDKKTLLAYEKEVLGIYVSGHPLEEYEKMWRNNITNVSTDFAADARSSQDMSITDFDALNVAGSLRDGASCVVGGLITAKTIKTTRYNTLMAFITVEDMYGSVEVIIPPRQYEKVKDKLTEDGKVFVRGKVSMEDERDAKVVLNNLTLFEDIAKTVYIRFKDMDDYNENIKKLSPVVKTSEGNDKICVVLNKERQMKYLGGGITLKADEDVLGKLSEIFGDENIAVKEDGM